MKRPAILSILILTLLLAGSAPAQQQQNEEITAATYNIENFREHFLFNRISSLSPPGLIDDPRVQEMLHTLHRRHEEDNWEIAQVILDPAFSPDVLVVQECCDQSDLKYFVEKWLGGAYETAIVFPSNTDHDQHLGLLLKPGFRVIERREAYHQEIDSTPNEQRNRLFARGPAFALIESPGGYRFWVGTNHQKSKADNSLEVARWRFREAKRTHEIIRELEREGPADVLFLGDMNDEPGIQAYELGAGGDAIAALVGPPQAGLELATRALAEAGKISYFGYAQTDFRSFIDHIILTREMKNQVERVQVFQNDFTAVASDHCPVVIRFRADPAPRRQAGN